MAGPKNHGNHRSLASLVPLQGTGHFHVEAVVGRDEMRADQEQHNVGLLEVTVDLANEFLSSQNAAVMPRFDFPLPLQ
ncbi:hypothetical protein D9M71_740390 [compost metagenome]